MSEYTEQIIEAAKQLDMPEGCSTCGGTVAWTAPDSKKLVALCETCYTVYSEFAEGFRQLHWERTRDKQGGLLDV